MPAPLAQILNPVNLSPRQHAARPSHTEPQEMSESAASLVSYKRVPKACTQCRRDKSRCDRARPCSGCVRKGRVDLCLDGCLACRRGRLNCDDGRPCASCVHDGHNCIEDDPAIPSASRKKQKASPSPSTVLTTTFPRKIQPQPHVNSPTFESSIKAPCLACRRDAQKCTGGDVCNRCEEQGERCLYVLHPPKSTKQRCALCRKKNKKCEQVRPCIHCIRADVPCVDLPRKGIGRGLRVKRACVGCRIDKIQCEEIRPCAGCKKKKIPCVERICTTCSGKGSCSSCKRQDRSHSEDSDTSSSASGSQMGDNDSASTLSLPSPASPPPYYDPPAPDPRHSNLTKSHSSSSLLEGSSSFYVPRATVTRSHSYDAPTSLTTHYPNNHTLRPDYMSSVDYYSRSHHTAFTNELNNGLPSFATNFSSLPPYNNHVVTRAPPHIFQK
ncbi:hypothetical protein K439DRAFT_218792 [Ramaria rubella]|nr:hypothetical protein K439DRAFT_218792 [Ramaria rubella]